MQVVDTSIIVRAAITTDPREREQLRDVIAETAREHDATLVSLDQRAVTRYSLVGADYRLM